MYPIQIHHLAGALLHLAGAHYLVLSLVALAAITVLIARLVRVRSWA